jgi:fructoselysine-6-P-deglycase FrlB-like protein
VTIVEGEISSQPQVWREAAALARSVSDLLPARGERVAFFGCGTSCYIAQAVAASRERSGDGESDAFAASELPLRRDYDVAIALSRSGTTTEVLEAVRALRPAGQVLAITADPDSPLVREADRVILMPFADERSVVQTRFATATVALFRAALGDEIETLAAGAERALAEPLTLEPPDQLRQLVFLGRGASVGLAREAALKAREAAGAWSEAYPALEYRHGPISVAARGTVVWALAPLPAGLAGEIEETGAGVVEPSSDPLVELVRVQRVAVQLALDRGLDPDRPRHLNRSVVLDHDGQPG